MEDLGYVIDGAIGASAVIGGWLADKLAQWQEWPKGWRVASFIGGFFIVALTLSLLTSIMT